MLCSFTVSTLRYLALKQIMVLGREGFKALPVEAEKSTAA